MIQTRLAGSTNIFFPLQGLLTMGCTSSRASHVTMTNMKSGSSGTKKKETRGEPDGEEKFGDICKYMYTSRYNAIHL